MIARRMLMAVLLALAATAPAHADEEPWAKGVTDDRKREAQKLLEAGNQQFIGKDYKAALATYEKAIAVWDHPAIRFNIVRSLVQLDRPIEAFEQLQLALKYGAKPLEDAVYTEALAYQKMLANQVSELSIKCDQTGADVTLDGKPLGKCPLVVSRKIQPGQHQVVGRLAGHQTKTLDLVLVGNKREEVSLRLERGETGTIVVHRWPTWIPWVVFGGGLAIAGVGGLLDLKAAADMASYDKAINAGCIGMACGPGEVVSEDIRTDAIRLSRISIGVMIVGAATFAVGGSMLYLNRGRRVSAESAHKLRSVSVEPTRGGATVGVAGRF